MVRMAVLIVVTVNIVVVLPGNRLLVNDLFLEPNTECYLVKDKEEMHGVFVSAEPKEVAEWSQHDT